MSLGIIGGSGLYQIEGMESIGTEKVDTPFGPPSDQLTIGRLGSVEVAFLPRHGIGHRLLPSEIPYRANIWALKSVGVERIVSISAVGSLREGIHPGDAVIVDQFIDRARADASESSFFGDGIAAHLPFADPICPDLAATLRVSAERSGWNRIHDKGVYVAIEGPLFSTRAESRLYQSWGADLVGMTNSREAKLAREAELCYATLALCTDYDCWKETEVSIEEILKTVGMNVTKAKTTIREVANAIESSADRELACSCSSALANCIVTRADLIPEEAKKRLKLLIGKYL